MVETGNDKEFILKRRKHKWLLTTLVFAALLGCGRRTGTPDRPLIKERPPLTGRGSTADYLLAAPVILVGLVLSAVPAEQPHPSQYGHWPVQLIRVKVKVENVLKGDVDAKEVNIFFSRSGPVLAALPGWTRALGSATFFFCEERTVP